MTQRKGSVISVHHCSFMWDGACQYLAAYPQDEVLDICQLAGSPVCWSPTFTWKSKQARDLDCKTKPCSAMTASQTHLLKEQRKSSSSGSELEPESSTGHASSEMSSPLSFGGRKRRKVSCEETTEQAQAALSQKATGLAFLSSEASSMSASTSEFSDSEESNITTEGTADHPDNKIHDQQNRWALSPYASLLEIEIE